MSHINAKKFLFLSLYIYIYGIVWTHRENCYLIELSVDVPSLSQFLSLKDQDSREFYVVQEHCAAIFEAPKL